ncbi:MAG: right-handed parallel beta-helix repeat-containing protein [Acidobacteria bacterium]|nr:right-handed parallel beta-helix repeat-containing protein [Acidobacteriota bacterium]
MSKIKFTLNVIALFAICLFASSQAQAQATRTWVSGVGDDVNPCSRTAPCKTFAGAISKTAKDGEISVLDPGGFGTITITKSLTIDGGSMEGSILASLASSGVLVNITDVNDIRKTVRLRKLNINGTSTGTDGVRVIATANHVFVQDTVIDGFADAGIDFSIGAGGASSLHVTNTTIRNCVQNGIFLKSTTATSTATIVRTQLSRTNRGVHTQDLMSVTVSDSVASGNTTAGFIAQNTSGGTSEMNVTNSVASNNGTGIQSSASTTVRISANQVFDNTTGVSVAGGVMETFSDNLVSGNNANLSGAVTAVGKL